MTWTKRALDQIDDISDYLLERNPRAAEDATVSFFRALRNLPHNPELGRLADTKDARELVVTGTPYLLGYRVLADRIEILSVWHGRRAHPR